MKLKEFIRDAHLKPWDGVIILVLILSSFYRFYFWPNANSGQRSRLAGRWDRNQTF